MTRRASTLPNPHGHLPAFQQAAALQAQGRLWEAEQLYEIALRADGRHFESLYRLGLIRLQQGRFADAAQLFRRAAKIDKTSADAQFHLGVALNGLGRAEDAIERYQKALALKPNFPEAHNNLGYALQMLGRHQEAITHYEKALAVHPDYAEARNNLGNALQMLDRTQAAIAQYEKALAIRPHYAEAHNNLGNVLATLRRHEEAITHYEKALAINPKYAEAHHSFGASLGATGRYDEAIEHYETALKLRPDYVEAQVDVSTALTALGRPEEAIGHCDAALALSPGHTGAAIARGNALVRMGQDASAAELFEHLLERGVRPISLLLALAQLPPSMVKIDLLSELDKTSRRDADGDCEFDEVTAFVRAMALDRAGRHAEAWQQLVAANRTIFFTNQEQYREACAREQRSLARLREGLVHPVTVDERGPTIPLLILGPSRSGKALVERLVSTLGDVKSGYENSTVDEALRHVFRAAGLARGTSMEHLPPHLRGAFRETYRGAIVKRAGSARVFTTTTPGRIHDADLMIRACANVRVILVKRNLEDNVLRIFQRRYNTGNVYAYDLDAAYEHVIWYHQMIDLLAERFGDVVRVIDYEHMIADPHGALRSAAELCGLSDDYGPLPALADDRGCAGPYRQLMASTRRKNT